MKIIPVIDVMNEMAVHAVRGKREEYRPLISVLCDKPDPVEVASALVKTGFNELYLADVDAILGKEANFDIYAKIIEIARPILMVDAGLRNAEDLKTAMKILEIGVSKVVIGTETLTELGLLRKAIEALTKEKVVMSFDMMDGKIVSRVREIESLSPASCARMLQEIGFDQMILIDLARVGTGRGPNFKQIEEVLKSVDAELIVGGGIRGIGDLIALREMGVSGALISTALHEGIVTASNLKSAGFL